ncbi:MAG: hypothetical protein LBV50_03500 [Novosphingobium sp.]|jgi:hypothetical protein|nr:hypothetical protein [Novosphingobium sp.]
MRCFIIGAIAFLGVIGAAVVAFMLIMDSLFGVVPTPSDDAMIAHFNARRAAFEQLAAMAGKDRQLERLAGDWSRPDDPAAAGIGPQRLARYRQLLRDAGTGGFYNFPNFGTVIFTFHSSGYVTSGEGRGFVHGNAPHDAEPVEGDLVDAADRLAADGDSHIYLARKIAPDWWITLQRN